jgi:hypothetical protein
MTAHRSLMLAVFLTVAPFVGRPAAADPILDFTGGSVVATSSDVTAGWKFTVTSPITIGGVGLFDVGANGLADSHQIKLWNGDGSILLGSTTITNLNSTSVASTSNLGNWRSISITSFQLNPGDYVVGAFYAAGTADFAVLSATASAKPGVTWNEYRLASASAFPTTFSGEGGNGFFGPNLFTATQVAPVPEPKTYAMLMAGLGLLGFIARRRSKSLNAAA